MDKHHKTHTPTFLENKDPIPTTFSTDIHDLITDNLPTASPPPAVSTHISTEPVVLLYEMDTSTLINSMAAKPNKECSLPFLQMVQLAGPGEYSVCGTGQVDDGAM